MDAFAANLRKYREAAGYTSARQFAREHGLKEATYAGYEGGIRRPTPDMVAQLARMLDVSTDYLLGTKELHREKTKFMERLLRHALDDNEFIEQITDDHIAIRHADSLDPLFLPRRECEDIIQQASDAMKANLRMMISRARYEALMDLTGKESGIVLDAAAEDLGLSLEAAEEEGLPILREAHPHAGMADYVAFRYLTGIPYGLEPSGEKIWRAHMVPWEDAISFPIPGEAKGMPPATDSGTKRQDAHGSRMTEAEEAAVSYVPPMQERLWYFERYLAKRMHLDYRRLLDGYGKEKSFQPLKDIFFDKSYIEIYDDYKKLVCGDAFRKEAYWSEFPDRASIDKGSMDWGFWGVDTSLGTEGEF